MEKETVTELIKHTFTEQERAEIAAEMAQHVSTKQRLEDEKKSVTSDYKAQIEAEEAKINLAARQLNNGYDRRNMKVEKFIDAAKKTVFFYNPETGDLVKERPMYSDEYQMTLDAVEQ